MQIVIMVVYNSQNVGDVLNVLHILKLKLIQVLFLCFFTSVIFSQNIISGEVEYIVKNDENFDPNKILNSEKVKTMDISLKNQFMNSMMQTGEFILIFNNKESLYQVKEDKMVVDKSQNSLRVNFLEYYGGGKSLFYSNLEGKKTIVQEESIVLDNELFLIEYDFATWKLTQETKKIGNYLCYKAVQQTKIKTKKETIVWYTPDIPFGFGPKLFTNLPGLVLEVQIGNILFVATKIKLTKNTKVEIEMPKEGKKISSSDYNNKIKEVGKKSGF